MNRRDFLKILPVIPAAAKAVVTSTSTIQRGAPISVNLTGNTTIAFRVFGDTLVPRTGWGDTIVINPKEIARALQQNNRDSIAVREFYRVKPDAQLLARMLDPHENMGEGLQTAQRALAYIRDATANNSYYHPNFNRFDILVRRFPTDREIERAAAFRRFLATGHLV